MTRQKIKKLYDTHENMLHKLSHECSLRCGRPESDVFGEACHLFMLAVDKYDPERNVPFGAFLKMFVKTYLIHWGINNPMAVEIMPNAEMANGVPDPRRSLIVKEWLEGLSEECSVIAHIVLDGPCEIMELASDASVRSIKGSLRKHLRSKMGWSWPKIWSALKEMKHEVARI